MYLPPDSSSQPLPLLVLFHGAGGDGDSFLRRLLPAVGAQRMALLAPDSRGSTWDAVTPAYSTYIEVIAGDAHLAGFGPDVAFVDQALTRVFDTVAIDPARIAVTGFSDGATYALSLGLRNGQLFHQVMAFSPGFIVGAVPDEEPERPAVFVAHGRADGTFPVRDTGARVVATLKDRGYDVTFRPFNGGHELPNSVATEAIVWFIDRA